MLRELPERWSSRDDFVDAVVSRGHDRGLARWLAMNVEAKGDEYVLRLDLDAISALLDDYFAVDLWPALESPAEGCRVAMIVGGDSPVFDEEDLARAKAIADARAETTLTVVEGAGHWVHVDAPDVLLAAWSRALISERRPA
jgi:pimeloyl-ACP methyl ester carboxylesterase